MTLTGRNRDTRVLFRTKADREELRREAAKRREAIKDWVLAIGI